MKNPGIIQKRCDEQSLNWIHDIHDAVGIRGGLNE